MIYPANFEHKIGFDQVRGLLRGKCFSALGETYVSKMAFSNDYKTVSKMLTEVREMMTLMDVEEVSLPTGSAAPLTDMLHRIRPVGTYLSKEEALVLHVTLLTAREEVDYLREREERYPTLSAHCEGLNTLSEITRRLGAIFDRFGEVKDTASPTLSSIRHALRAAQGSVSRAMSAILRQAQAEGYIERDVTPTLREGRLVIPVMPMHKRHISGIIHDESATGKTVFIEPTAVVEANNHIRSLQADEQREIIAILTGLTDMVRPMVKEIFALQNFVSIIDGIRAKALFARDLRGICPEIEEGALIKWEEARHPLLQLALEKQGKEVSPLDIKLNEEQRILLISGPNAGGKSVCLKSVALLQYMLQCGVPIPVAESSKAGMFNSIFIDIGDEQSIENDLSTYSSHLLNMKHFMRHSDEKTLLLIDEFGTGTEPQMGGAIAEAVLEKLNNLGVWGVITTHYTNLKQFATDTEGIVNGAMLYDRHLMRPLFQLQIGNPGSSFAIEIARKIGFPEEVIATATEKAGTTLVEFDKYLQDVVRDKRYWEAKRAQIRAKEKQTEEVLVRYEQELAELQKKQKGIIKEAKSNAEQLLNSANATIENTIRKIKESQAEKEATKAAREELETFRKKQHTNIATPTEEKLKEVRKKVKPQVKKKKVVSNEPLKVGDNVRVKGATEMRGVIMEIGGQTVTVAIGDLKTKVKMNQLERLSNNQVRSIERSPSAITRATEESLRQRKLSFHPDIDIRGMRGSDAMEALMHFIDDAQMLGVGTIRVLHGTGNGILRTLTRDYLKKIHIKTYRDEHVQFGGAGITVVELQ